MLRCCGAAARWSPETSKAARRSAWPPSRGTRPWCACYIPTIAFLPNRALFVPDTSSQRSHAQVRLLVEGGAPLGNADDEGLTPLHLAAYSGKLEERPIYPLVICIKGNISIHGSTVCHQRNTPSYACSERLAHCVAFGTHRRSERCSREARPTCAPACATSRRSTAS